MIIRPKSIKTILNRLKSDSLSTIRSFSEQSHGSLALFSLSNNIITNLALENLIAESINKRPDLSVLLFWISEPCIVFGRHQNPWLECDVKRAREENIKLVRRYSGGGCVYHDLGNLNISFLTNRLNFDRRTNLGLIKNALEDSGLFENAEFEVTPRHDIYVRDISQNESFKITGSAARLAQKFSYHHCTLLYNANIQNMKLLRSPLAPFIRTKATPSVPAKCSNMSRFLVSRNQDAIMKIVEVISRKYWERNRDSWSIEYLYNYVMPDQTHNLGKSIEELASWEHKFGHTPKFTVNIQVDQSSSIDVKIENGIVDDFEINGSNNADTNINEFIEFFKTVKGNRLDYLVLKQTMAERSISSVRNYYISKFVAFLNKYI